MGRTAKKESGQMESSVKLAARIGFIRSSRSEVTLGFRFCRSVTILPGISLNFGKGGVSTSIGVCGAYVTVGRTGMRTTVGLPGTGVSYIHLEKSRQDAPGEAPAGMGSQF
jgi:hypothetical protein